MGCASSNISNHKENIGSKVITKTVEPPKTKTVKHVKQSFKEKATNINNKYSIVIEAKKSKKLSMIEYFPLLPKQISLALGVSIKNIPNYQSNIEHSFTSEYGSISEEGSLFSDSILWTLVKNSSKDKKGYIELSQSWEYTHRVLKNLSELSPEDEIIPFQKLSDEERNLFLRPTKFLNFDSKNFIKFIKDKNLIISNDESEVDFCVRVQEEMAHIIEYFYGKFFVNVTDIIKEGKGDCGSHSSIFMAILRANNIPCRGILGLFHDPTSLENKLINAGDYKSRGNILAHMVLGIHMRCEVYFEGIGWIMVEPTSKSKYGIFLNDEMPFITRYFHDGGSEIYLNKKLTKSLIMEQGISECNYDIGEAISKEIKLYTKKSLEDLDSNEKSKLIKIAHTFYEKVKNNKLNENKSIFTPNMFEYVQKGDLSFLTNSELVGDFKAEILIDHDIIQAPISIGNSFFLLDIHLHQNLISGVMCKPFEASAEMKARLNDKFINYYRLFIDRINQGLLVDEWNSKSSFKTLFENNYDNFYGFLAEKNLEILEIYCLSDPSNVEAKLSSVDGPIFITIWFDKENITGIYKSEKGYKVEGKEGKKLTQVERLANVLENKIIYHSQTLEVEILEGQIKSEQILYIKFA